MGEIADQGMPVFVFPGSYLDLLKPALFLLRLGQVPGWKRRHMGYFLFDFRYTGPGHGAWFKCPHAHYKPVAIAGSDATQALHFLFSSEPRQQPEKRKLANLRDETSR